MSSQQSLWFERYFKGYDLSVDGVDADLVKATDQFQKAMGDTSQYLDGFLSGLLVLLGEAEGDRLSLGRGVQVDGRVACEGCAKVQVPSENVAFQYCGQCKIVQYCSRACQQTDWKRHKSLCKSWTRFSTQAYKGNPLFPVLLANGCTRILLHSYLWKFLEFDTEAEAKDVSTRWEVTFTYTTLPDPRDASLCMLQVIGVERVETRSDTEDKLSATGDPLVPVIFKDANSDARAVFKWNPHSMNPALFNSITANMPLVMLLIVLNSLVRRDDSNLYGLRTLVSEPTS